MSTRRKLTAQFGRRYRASHPLTRDQIVSRLTFDYGLMPWQRDVLRLALLGGRMWLSRPQRYGMTTLRRAFNHYSNQVAHPSTFVHITGGVV